METIAGSRDKKEGFEDEVVKSYKDALARLQKELGDLSGKWQWGKYTG
jgi:acyl-homoserine lactone acylase PvdQ